MAVIDLGFLRSPAPRRRIVAITTAVTALALVYSLLAPKWYRAQVTVVPAKAQRGGGSGLASLMSGLGGLSSGLEAAAGGADIQRIAAVFQSDTVTDAVVQKFDLKQRYGEPFQETARAALWSHCSVKALPKPNLVQLSCEDKDPKFVQELLAFFASHGNDVFRRVNISSASEEVRFLERRVAELSRQADASAARMREFQEKHQVVDLESQTKAVVSRIAGLQSQRTAKQLELDYARGYASADEPVLRQLQSQLRVIDDQLRDLERTAPAPAARGGRSGTAGLFPAALDVPKLRAEFESLYRDRKVTEAVLISALERLESARADEARDVSTFQVLDPPVVPTRKARPKRAVIVLFGMALGLGGAIAYEWRRQGGKFGELARALLGESRRTR